MGCLMSDLQALLRHTPFYALASVLNRGSGFLLVLVYTTFLDEPGYGLVGAAMAVAEVAGIALSLQVGEALARLQFDRGEPASRGATISTALITILVLVVAGGILLALTSPWISSFVAGSSAHALVIAGGGVAAGFDALFNAGLTVRRAGMRSGSVLAYSTARSVLLLGGSSLLVGVFAWGPSGAIVALLAANAFAGLTLTGVILCEHGFTFRRDRARELLRYGLALCPSWGAEALAKLAERTLLVHAAGLAAAGLWYLALRLADLLNALLVGPFSQVWMVRRLAAHQQGVADTGGTRAFIGFALLLAWSALALGLFAPEILALVSRRPGYADAAPYVAVAAASTVVFACCSAVEVGLHLDKLPARIAGAVGVASALHVALAAVGAFWGGLAGIAWARLAAMLLRLVAMGVAARGTSGPRPPWMVIGFVLAVLAAGIAATRVSPDLGFAARVGLAMAAFVILAVVFRSTVRSADVEVPVPLPNSPLPHPAATDGCGDVR